MLTKNEIKSIEKKYGFFPQKKLGQSFLVDANIKDKIIAAACLGKDDTVIEIGSGLGQLTFELAKAVKRVVAVEFDKKIFSALAEFTKDNARVVLVREDFLKLDIRRFAPRNKRLKVVSNLPYYISSPVLLKLFAYSGYIDCAVLTLQKEVAARLTAAPGTKEYGSLTLFADFHSEIKRLFDISRHSFYPRPQVDSTVISLSMRREPPVASGDKNELFDLIRAGFSKRRKTLVNAVLSQGREGVTKENLGHCLNACGIPINIRAEALSLSDFSRISDLLNKQ